MNSRVYKGHCRNRTIESALDEAKQYSSRTEFATKAKAVYLFCRSRGILDQACSHMPPLKVSAWTVESAVNEAKKYRNRRDFTRKARAAHSFLKKQGLLELAYQHFSVTKRQWTNESAIQEAQKFNTRTEFIQKASGAYHYCLTAGILEQAYAHMPALRNAFDLEETLRSARQFKTRQEWRNARPDLVASAEYHGIYDECVAHMNWAGGTSIAEKDLLQMVVRICSDVQSSHRLQSASYVLDLFSPSKKIGIEYNGLYWHNEESKGKRYHLDKTNACKAQGIRLIHIWEHEWRDRRPQVLSFLRSALNANPTKIGARRCEFRWVEPSEVKALLESTHIQGFAHQSTSALAVYHQGELVGCATFGRHHRGKQVMVLNRLVFKDGVTVSGGFSKISKMAAERFGTIISWVDLAKSDGAGYLRAGWQVDEILRPDYFYHDRNGNVHSKQSRKKSAVKTPEGMTEREHALLDGLHRVWDCGKMRLSFPSRQRSPVVSSSSHEEDRDQEAVADRKPAT